MLRFVVVPARISVRVVDRRCGLSTSTSTSTSTSASTFVNSSSNEKVLSNKHRQLRVVSRRAWDAHHQAKRVPKLASTTAAASAEKPWPRSVIIARNVVACVLIPYTMAWGLSIHEPSRRWAEQWIPGLQEMLRTYFGRPEHDGIAYPEMVAGQEPPYQLEDEPPLHQRQQDTIIQQQLLQSDIPVTVMRIDDGGMVVTKELAFYPGTITPSMLVGQEDKDGTRLAIDFPDLAATTDTLMDDGIATTATSPSTSSPLTQYYHTYSSWFYQSPPPTAEQQRQKQTMSNIELELSRLEYTVATLEAELSNVLSTRNMDDMRQELADAKSQLRGLRWKKRFGMTH